MSLEFSKITEQVYKMGAMVEKLDFDLREYLQIAKERFHAASDLDLAHERITLVRQTDMSGYRGAAPLDPPYSQPINFIVPPPPTPARVTVLAADGSQIYPDEHAPVHYYLINVGLFIYHHGHDQLPEQITIPTLAFHKDHVHDKSGQLVSNRTVDARRTVAEMRALGEKAWELKNRATCPIIALYDNQLMFWTDADVVEGGQLMKDYRAALQQLYDVQANGIRTTLAGYIDSPIRSRVVLRLLHLLSFANAAEVHEHKREIEIGGDLEGLRDVQLFRSVLRPGERSAIMAQNSPRNLAYKEHNPSHEIAFFYLKSGTATHNHVARVDIPLWVARDKQAVDDLHAMLLAQATMQGRNPYPYALTRADELAYVSGKDKAKLDEMVHLELRRKGIDPIWYNPKARGKELARSTSQPYDMDTKLR